MQKSWIKKLCIIKTIKQRLWSLIVKLIDFFGKQLPNQCLRRSAKLTPSWQDGSWWSTFLHSLSSSKWLLNRWFVTDQVAVVCEFIVAWTEEWRSLIYESPLFCWTNYYFSKMCSELNIDGDLPSAHCKAYSALQHRNNVLRLCCDFNNGT